MYRNFTAFVAAAAVFAITAGAAGAADNTCPDQQYTVKIATVAPKGTPWSDLLLLYKKNVEKRTNGCLKVKVYLGGTLGDELETVRKTKSGIVQGVGASTGAVASLVPELNVVEIPFMFRGFREADYVMDRILLEPMEALFAERGLVLGFWSENGFRHFGSKSPITQPQHLKGMKMRSQESFVHLKMWEALDAAPQAIPTTEVLTALQAGTVDGFDQALLYAIAANWHKSVKHVTLSSHIYQPAVIMFNKEWFDTLPEPLQKALLEEGRAIVRKGRKLIRALNPDLVDILKSEKIAIHELSPGGRDKFEAATKGVRTQFRAEQGDKAAKVLDLVEAGLADYRKRGGKP